MESSGSSGELNPTKSNAVAPGPFTTAPYVKPRSTGTGCLGLLGGWERSALRAASDVDELKVSIWALSSEIKPAGSICGEHNRKLCSTSPPP